MKYRPVLARWCSRSSRHGSRPSRPTSTSPWTTSAVRGISIAGLGVGSGGSVTGLSIAGSVSAPAARSAAYRSPAAVGSPRLSGIVITGMGAGTLDFNGGVIAPFYFRIARDGSIRGVSVSAFNRLSGDQHGLTIGVLNIAENLRGVQIGLLNIARNNPRGRPVLPIVNWGVRN